jgi:hypothetical protein
LKEAKWKKYYWLDLDKLCAVLLQPYKDQALTRVKYFTARITRPQNKAHRQNTYLQALETLKNLDIFYGKYLESSINCPNCGNSFIKPFEKMTDVNIAIEMTLDAVKNNYDIAYLISGDSDLTPVIKKINENFPEKKIIVFFPPNRHSKSLISVCHSNKVIFRKTLSVSQFPEQLESTSGFPISRPLRWH